MLKLNLKKSIKAVSGKFSFSFLISDDHPMNLIEYWQWANSESTLVHKVVLAFQKNCFNVDDNSRSGQSKKFEDEKLQMLMEDSCEFAISGRETTEILNDQYFNKLRRHILSS